MLLRQTLSPLVRRSVVCQRCWNLKHHRCLTTLSGETDRFDGVTVDVAQIPESLSEHEFGQLLHGMYRYCDTCLI